MVKIRCALFTGEIQPSGIPKLYCVVAATRDPALDIPLIWGREVPGDAVSQSESESVTNNRVSSSVALRVTLQDDPK